MKTAIFATAATVITMLSAPAMAWEGQKVACYDKHWVPATYTTSKTLKHAARTAWEHHGDQVVKVYYPPVYIEHQHKASDGHYVLRQAACD